MRQILQMAIELDTMACDAYKTLTRICDDEELRHNFELLAREEATHVQWWTELLEAWSAGLLPDIADEHHLHERLAEMHAELQNAMPADDSTCTVDEALDMAVRFEFYMLDPLFGELVDLMRPAGKGAVRESYSRHVLRLIELVERRYTRPGLAAFLAGVLRHAYRDQQRLAALAVRDPLTGLYNRRGLLGHLKQWLSWSTRYGRPLGAVLIDVDHFKQINDTFGHNVGDEALAAIASSLAGTIRSSDVVGRFGGDEFLVVAPEADEEELDALMKRIVEDVREATVTVGDKTVTLSVSTGGAWTPGGIEITPELFVAQADQSMYKAKGAGRDRAGVATSAVAG